MHTTLDPSSTACGTDCRSHAATAPVGACDGGPRTRDGECTTGVSKAGAPKSIRFVVPGQPQGKGRPRVGNIGGHARMFTPAKTVAYEGVIGLHAQIAMANRDLLDEPVLVRMFVACQVPASWSQRKQRDALEGRLFPSSKPDVDNVVKAVFDGINGVVWRDDVLVVDLELKKRYSSTPRVEVEIVPMVMETPREAEQARQLELAGDVS